VTEDTALLDNNRYSDLCRGKNIGSEVVGNDLTSYQDAAVNI